MNNTLLEKLKVWCDELGVSSTIGRSSIVIDKKQLVELVGNEKDVLKTLKEISSKYIIANETDEYYFVETF